jgi:hypothetical protein
VARAKRTDRADARRRYRQVQTDDPGSPESAEIGDEATLGAARRAPGPAPRGSFFDGLRASIHRPDLRADIAALPWLVTTRAFYIPVLLLVGGFAAILAVPTSPVVAAYYRLMVLPPAMAPVFIAGFFAKRASYLLGLIIATLDVVLYTILVFGFASSASGGGLTAAQQTDFFLSAVTVGPLSGLLFASAAAWYKRFLAMSSAQRAGARGASARGANTRKPVTRAKTGRAGR